MNERLKFVAAAQSGRHSMTELCASYGISRKTGYKILSRYERDGPDALRDQSRAPRTHPNQTSAELEAAILRVRKAHPTWAKKILAILARDSAHEELPARSTVDAILTRAGVVCPRRGRVRRQPSSAPTVVAAAANDVWSIDYKGWFRVGDGTLRSADGERLLQSSVVGVPRAGVAEARGRASPARGCLLARRTPALHAQRQRPAFRLERAGKAVSLGRVAHAPGRAAGVDRARPSGPKRTPRALPRDAEGRNRNAAARRSARSKTPSLASEHYNEERPHEALGMRVPAQLYTPSPRPMTRHLPDHEYASSFETRRIRRDGTMKWAGGYVFVGEAFATGVSASSRPKRTVARPLGTDAARCAPRALANTLADHGKRRLSDCHPCARTRIKR
ncbi:MAG: helix-turn-helix domain-containing protein [Planctomycetes bacterium]|nr:helix-turn-helix domain-containing protein [Planctomycetota bacterium]